MSCQSALVFRASDGKDPAQIYKFRGSALNAFYSKQARNVAKLLTVQSPPVIIWLGTGHGR